jgi:hypothetical protein
MNKMLSALVLASAVALAAGPAAWAGDDAVATMKPRQGVTLDLGSKRSVGFFLADAATCNLTVLVAEAVIDGADEISAPARLQFAVGAGHAVRVDTADGKAMRFTCSGDAQSMTVSRLAETGAYTKG